MRPKPTILLTDGALDILAAPAIWAVFYQGRPINLRANNVYNASPIPKYPRAAFSNSGHAFNLAAKLNDQFSTGDFSVVELKAGATVIEVTAGRRVVELKPAPR